MSTNKLYDVVYIVKEDPNNEELRYSIRSVEENFPVRYIWIFGYCPRWLSNIIYVPVKQDGDKWSNSKKLFETIANASFLPDQFVLFNDDFFVMEKIDRPEHHYDGLLIDRINYLEDKFKNTSPLYATQLRQVYDRLQELGIKDPNNYALHTPMSFSRLEMKKSLELTKDLPMSLRSFYANYFNVGGVEGPDCKVFRLGEYNVDGPYLSTDDSTFRLGQVGRDIRAKFIKPSSHE